MHLLIHYHWQNINYDRNQYHHIKIQYKPGTEKLFVMHTMRNITKLLLKTNKCDGATTPICCAASLINNKTRYKSLKYLQEVPNFMRLLQILLLVMHLSAKVGMLDGDIFFFL